MENESDVIVLGERVDLSIVDCMIKYLALAATSGWLSLSCALADPVSRKRFTSGKHDANAPSALLNFSVTNEMDFDDLDGGFSLQRVDLNVPFGGLWRLSDNSGLLFDFKYQGTYFDFNSQLDDEDLHRLRLGVSWLYSEEGSKWSWLVSVEPSIASDFRDIDSDDIFINWKIGGRYELSDQFTWIFGAGSVASTGGGVLPAVGFQWRPSDELYLSLIGPKFITTYQPCEDWLWRFGIWADGGKWNIEQNGDSLDLKLTSFRAGVGLEHQLRDKVWLNVWTGAVFGNELEVETTGGSSLFKEEAETGWFARIGLRVAAW